MSFEPPGAKGTTSVTGFSGNAAQAELTARAERQMSCLKNKLVMFFISISLKFA
jgi:hypothetical protein